MKKILIIGILVVLCAPAWAQNRLESGMRVVETPSCAPYRQAPAWQTREASEEAARELPGVKSRLSELEARCRGFRHCASHAERCGRHRMAARYRERVNALTRAIRFQKGRIDRLERAVSAERQTRAQADEQEASTRFSADRGFRNQFSTEARERKNADWMIIVGLGAAVLIIALGLAIREVFLQ